MKYIYLGSFPPPFGGVTIKNNMLFNVLNDKIFIEKINFSNVKKKNLNMIIKLLRAIFGRDICLIIGASGKSRRMISKWLYYFNKRTMKNSILIVMGGTASSVISRDNKYLKWVSNYKRIYVEAEGMKKELEKSLLSNVSVFPNCRIRPSEELEIKSNTNHKLKCVFFSQISKEKGADIAIEAFNILQKQNVYIELDFYGHIVDEYFKEYHDKLSSNEKIHYRGIFKSNGINVYKKLNEYDLLIFPTRWKHEGVPGILIESKIASLPAIVSDVNFNSEIIDNNITGIVLKNNIPSELSDRILELYKDRDLLNIMKGNAKKSAEMYYVDNYMNNIIEQIKANR